MNWTQKTKETKSRIARLMDEESAICETKEAASLALPEPNDLFKAARALLDKQDFDIAVCGDASQGKSAFINALLEERLLPSNDHPTTSQLFRVSNAEQRRFAFVFADGTERTFDDTRALLAYGTALGVSDSIDGKELDYIDVALPLGDRLPAGIHIWDTPGLGVTHFSHEEITARCIARCNAFLFLSSPARPLTDTELAFLEKAFEQTGECLFVQSQIDKFDEAKAAEISARNAEILENRFGKLLEEKYGKKGDFRFVQCSAENALKASGERNEALRRRRSRLGRFDVVHSELSGLMYRTACAVPSALACAQGLHQQSRLSDSVRESVEALGAAAKKDMETLQTAKKKQRERFEDAWGHSGEHYLRLWAEIDRIFRSAENRARLAFSVEGALRDRFAQEIDCLSSVKEIQQYAERLETRLPDEIATTWRSIAAETNATVLQVLSNCSESVSREVAPPELSTDEPSSLSVLISKESPFDMYRDLTRGAAIGGGIAASATTVTYGILLALAGPTGGLSIALGELLLAFSPTAVGSIWGGVRGFLKGKKARAAKAKEDLKDAIDGVFRQTTRDLLDTPVGGFSKLEQRFQAYRDWAQRRMDAIVEAERKNLEAACARLDEQSAMDETRRKQELEAVSRLQDRLKMIGERLTAELDALKGAFA